MTPRSDAIAAFETQILEPQLARLESALIEEVRTGALDLGGAVAAHNEALGLQEHRHLRGQQVLFRAEGAPMTVSSLREAVARAARRANLRGSGPHMLRHSFCSRLAMGGAAPRAIQELAGHRDLGTTQRYMHLSPAAGPECDSVVGSAWREQRLWRHFGHGDERDREGEWVEAVRW